MVAFRQRCLVLDREQVSCDRKVAAVITSRQAELGGWVRRRAAPNNDGAYLVAGQKAGQTRRRRARRRLTGEEVAGARESEARGVQDLR